MKDKKKLKNIVLVMLTALVMAAALFFFTYPKEKPPYIIYIPKIVDQSNEFWATLLAGADMAAKEYGANLSVMAADSEDAFEQQNQMIKKAISMEPDVIVVSPSSFTENTETLKEVQKAGIPLVYIDSITDEALASSVVATNNVEMGEQLGAYIKRRLPLDPHIAIMGHVKNSSTALEREEGIRKGLEEYADQIEEVQFCDSSFQKAYSMTKELMEKNPDINVLVGLNEYSSTGAAQAIQDLGLTGQVKLFGTDSSTNQIQKLEEGVYQGIVIQNPFNMGYLGIVQAVGLAKGQKTEPEVPVESYLITKKNMYAEEEQKILFPFIGKQATQDIVFE